MSKYLGDLSLLKWMVVGDIPNFPFTNGAGNKQLQILLWYF